jgi:hypothetical protein
VSLCDAIIGLLCELTGLIILKNVFSISMDFVFNTTTFNKVVYGSYPSLTMYLLITILISVIIKKRATKNTYKIEEIFDLINKES